MLLRLEAYMYSFKSVSVVLSETLQRRSCKIQRSVLISMVGLVRPYAMLTGKLKEKRGLPQNCRLDVQIHLEVDETDKLRVPRCLNIFENYCTVTQSVRKGIEVKVNIK